MQETYLSPSIITVEVMLLVQEVEVCLGNKRIIQPVIKC